MADKLKSPVTHIAQGGHLMASDGFTELPQAWEALKPMLEAKICPERIKHPSVQTRIPVPKHNPVRNIHTDTRYSR